MRQDSYIRVRVSRELKERLEKLERGELSERVREFLEGLVGK